MVEGETTLCVEVHLKGPWLGEGSNFFGFSIIPGLCVEKDLGLHKPEDCLVLSLSEPIGYCEKQVLGNSAPP